MTWPAGGADGSLKVWDKRNVDKAAFSFHTHTSPLLRVEWANYACNPGEGLSPSPNHIVLCLLQNSSHLNVNLPIVCSSA
jgi:hypothetical protein